MSGSASSEISEMLDARINSVTTMSQNTNQRIQMVVGASREKITIANQPAKECSNSFDEIQSRVTTILQTSMSILQAASEQSKGIEKVSQQNMNMSRLTADQSLVLSRQTQALNEISEVVLIVVMGSRRKTPTTLDYKRPEKTESNEEAA